MKQIHSTILAFICLFLTIQNNFKCITASFELTPGVLVFDVDLNTDIASNPHIDNQLTSAFLFNTAATTNNNNGQGGISSTVDPSSVPSYSRGLVGLYHFDAIVEGTTIIDSSGPGDIILRGSVPCSTAYALTNPCQDASLIGDGDASIPPLSPSTDAKFGTAALNVQHESWAEIQPGPFKQNQPMSGITVASWIKSDDTVLKGKLWERLFDNFDLIGGQRYDSNCFSCEFGGADGTFGVYFYARHCFEANEPLDTNAWMHVACSYDPTLKQLTIYYNGVASETTNVTLSNTDFRHGDYQPIGIGNRGGGGAYRTTNGFDGKMDDFALWGRALSSMEINDLYSSNAPIELVEFPILETVKFIKMDPPTEREFSAVTMSWTMEYSEGSGVDTSIPPPASALTVEISTDGGKEWCEVSRDVVFTDAFHGGDNLICLFPAVSLKIRVRWNALVTLTSLRATFHPVSPLEGTYSNVPIGINVGGVSYYQSSWTFVDIFKSSGGCCWPYIRSGTDSNGWPLEIDPVLDDDGSYWKIGRAIIGRRGFYPAGEYTLYAEGSGSIGLAFDSGNHNIQAPCTYKFNVTTPTGSGTQITFESSQLGDHIRNVRVMMPGYAESTDLFHPEFLSSLQGFSLLRFMDWGATNSANTAKWYQRTTPTSISQSRTIVEQFDIVNTTITNDTLFSGSYLVLAYTSSPHTLVTGQVVTVSGTRGNATATNGATATFDFSGTMVEVVDDRSFIYSFKPWSWDDSYVIESYQTGYGGKVTVDIRTGVSLEYQIELANTMNVDAWFNVPHLADDTYIRNMAELIYTNLKPNLKAYVEYSNEIWNWAPAFVQTRYAYKKATEVGLTGGSRHLQWYGQKVASVMSIFSSVFGNDTSTRLVRVLAVQGGTGYIQLDAAGGSASVDALAIAPYFGGSLNYRVSELGWENFDVDDILDMARSEIIDDSLRRTRASFLYAQQSGVHLIAYEGGQHMGGSGDCYGVDCTSIDGMQALFQAANHNHRIKGLYKNMLKAWQQEGGKEFASFSHIGEDSKYGSWGILQHQMDDKSTAWKYQALMENLGESVETTVKPSSFPSQMPSSQPSPKTTLKPSRNPTREPSEVPTHKPSRATTGSPTRSPSKRPTQSPSLHPSINTAPSGISPSQIPTKSLSSNSPSTETTSSPTRKRYPVVTTKCSCIYPLKGILQEELNAQFDAIVDILTKAISAKVSDESWKVQIIRVAGRNVRKLRLLLEERFLQNDIIDVEVELTKVNICLSDDGCTDDDVNQSREEGLNALSNVVESVASGTLVQQIQDEAAAVGLSDALSTISIDEVVTEEPRTEVVDPTPFPSTDVTSPPSASPSSTLVNYWCDDSPFRFKVRYSGQTKFKSCAWVARHPGWKCQLEGVSAHCPSTCETCKACSDSTSRFILLYDDDGISKSLKSCDWVARKDTEARCAIPGISQTCRSTCGTCCMDSMDDFTFTFNGNQLTKPCEWVARINTKERCQVSVVSFHCPQTCGTCCIDSMDELTFTFNGNQLTKPCAWVARNNTEERCQVPQVSLNCPKTCGSC